MLERFVKECRIPIKQGLGLQKKSKDNKLYVNWKGYDSLFNSWINKKGIVQILAIILIIVS